MTILAMIRDVNNIPVDYFGCRAPSNKSVSGNLVANITIPITVPDNNEYVWFKFSKAVDVWVGLNTDSTPSGAGDDLLLEDGDAILLEDGDNLLLEGGNVGNTLVELNPYIWPVKPGDIIYITPLANCNFSLLFYTKNPLTF